jgi:ABC-type branched-subunit amino acid transport system substrate-binding protein
LIARAARLAVPIALAVSLVSCAGFPPFGRRGPTDAERREFEAALATARRDPNQGRLRLSAFLSRHPDSALADDAVVPFARLERKAGHPEIAERRLRAVLEDHGRDDRSDAARLELAEIVLDRGDADAAAKIAKKIQVSMLREDERPDAYRLLADVARRRGDAAEQLEWLMRLRGALHEGDDVVAVDREIDAVISGLSLDGLVQVADHLGRRAPAGRVWLRAANLAVRAGDRATATHALARAQKLELTQAEADQAARLEATLGVRREAESERGAPPPLTAVSGTDTAAALAAGKVTGAIGVVLPFSGPLAKVAEDVLRGVLLAANAFGPVPAEGGGLHVLVRDSGGDPARAADAVRELGARGDVAAVIGPLTKEEVEAASVPAQETGVSLLTLTRHETVARDHPQVVRFGLTRRMEVEVLADHAVQQLGLSRFAILYPKDEYGREFESLLWQAVEERGARVVAVAGYKPTATDFAAAIARLLGPQSEQHPAAPGTPVPQTPPPAPLVDFDALFIPDAHDKVALIALQLAASQIRGVQLLGPSGWHHPDLLRIAGPAVDGAVFSSGFDPGNPAPVIQDFVGRYKAAFAADPTLFAAQGFDAANLVALQLARGAHTAADVHGGLVETKLYPGVSGVTSIGADGDARKRPFLIEVREGRLTSLE